MEGPRDGGIKGQETRLTLQEHDADDDDIIFLYMFRALLYSSSGG